MKTKKVFALLLVIALSGSMLAACGSESTSSSGSVAQSASETSVSEEPASSVSDENVASQEESVVQTEPELETSSTYETLYPVCDGTPIDLTIMINVPPVLPVDYSEMGAIQTCMEEANVDLEFISIAQDSYYEKFNLMCVSQDYYDLVSIPETVYTGGIKALVDDEICINLAPYFETCMPDYYNNVYAVNDDYRAQSTSDDGEVVTIWAISEEFQYGAVVRQDLLTQLDMEIPTTYDQVEDFLTACKSELGLSSPTVLVSNWFLQDGCLSGGLGVNGYATTGDIAWQINEDKKTVEASIATEASKEYITMLHRWWENDLIGDVSLTTTNDPTPLNDEIYTGSVGFWYGKRDTFNTTADELAPDGFDAIPIADITRTGNETVPYGLGGATLSTTGGLAITTQCAYPEEACKVLNWFFSDKGQIAINFGEENYTFTYDETGQPVFTDLITNNPDFTTFQAIQAYLVFPDFPGYYTAEGVEMGFVCEKEIDAQNVWPSNRSNDLKYYGTMTIEESKKYGEIVSDIETMVAENVSKFVVGDRDIDEWDEFIETLYDNGLSDLIEIKQDAYDRFLNR